MLEAAIRGKIPSSAHGREDFLTSCVFGTLDLLPASLGLAPWLRGARSLDGAAFDVSDALLDRRRPEFWPRYRLGDETVEPDLVLDCGELILIIEAKYGAGPSGMPNEKEERLCGQLGRQWQAVRAAAPAGDRRLIYLTADWSMPQADMEAMICETEAKLEGAGMREGLYWLSWRTLLASLSTVDEPPRYRRAVDGLRTFLKSRGLDMFRGVEPPAVVPRPSWSYG